MPVVHGHISSAGSSTMTATCRLGHIFTDMVGHAVINSKSSLQAALLTNCCMPQSSLQLQLASIRVWPRLPGSWSIVGAVSTM